MSNDLAENLFIITAPSGAGKTTLIKNVIEFAQINDKKVDFNVACTRCDYSGYRVLSSDFGNGFSSKNGDTISSLNREGERWSSAADSMLGHDGARPYLSPVADFRRGISHT